MKINIPTSSPVDEKQKEIYSNLFRANNKLGAKDVFNAKKKFIEEGYLTFGPYTFDIVNNNNFSSTDVIEDYFERPQLFSLFNETYLPLFGSVDNNVIPLQPKKEFLSYYLEDENGFTALDFVVNSFINMRTAYSRGLYEGKGILKGSKLSKLEVVKAMDNGDAGVQKNLDILLTDFVRFTRLDSENRKLIVTPQNFINYFTNYLLSRSPETIINYSSMMLGGNIDLNFNGLCLDIAKIDYDSDKSKIKDIILDPNFSYYMDTAQQFGFVISKEYPFKLIANLNSERMRDNICVCSKNYQNNLMANNIEDIVNFYFEPSYLYDILHLRSLYETAYLSFFDTFRYENILDYKDGDIQVSRLYRMISQVDDFANLANDKFLLSLYIRIKNKEMRLNFNEGSLKRFDQNAKFIYDKYGLANSLKYINEKLRLALEPFMPDKKNFVNTENFSIDEALGLIRLSRYDY